MKDNNKRKKLVRNRKIAHIATISRRTTVNNCTILKAYSPSSTEWKIPENGYKQPKSLHKKIVIKQTGKIIKSNFPDYKKYEKMLWKNMGIAAKQNAHVDLIMKQWEAKHPKPCEKDDIFKDEFIPIWNEEREKALENARNLVVSIYNKLQVIGRFEINNVYEEKPVTNIKGYKQEGHHINVDDLKQNSKTIKKVQLIANNLYKNNKNLYCVKLKDYKGKIERVVLPKAA